MTTEEKQAARDMSLLYDVSQAVIARDEVRQILRTVLDIIANKIGVMKGMLTILNRKTGEIFIHDAFGLTNTEQKKGRYQLGEGIIGQVVETGEIMVVPKISEDPRFLDRTGSRAALDTENISFICVPIKTGQEVIGTLSADRIIDGDEKNGHSLEHDVRILSIIASMISQAVRLHQLEHEEHQHLVDENKRLTEELKEKYRPSNIIGNSKAMRSVYTLIGKIAPTPTTVLILGESGVGKELVADAIHYASPRAENPFIKFNCAALPETIIESELFGHEKGSFTGASASRKGRFELANTGTIFLDEIGELSLAMQSKLLRVLQQKTFERVGGSETIQVDVRVIAATNRPLEEGIQAGTFREDLYYRLNVFAITMPPLRERKTDIPLLADYFVEKYSVASDKRVLRISTPAIDMIMGYHWPGNVRELENCIERAVILSDDGVIHGYHLPPTLQTAESSNTAPAGGTLTNRIESFEKEIIVESLKQSRGNMAEAAKELGLTERVMGLRVRKYEINFKDYRV